MTKILLCDDSPFILSIFEKRLKNKGFMVTGKAQDGDEVVRLFEELHPDIVLLDITMPKKTGTSALKEILTIDPNAKVIVISAVKDMDVIQDCMRSGAKAYIPKSTISLEEEFSNKLLNTIKDIVAKKI